MNKEQFISALAAKEGLSKAKIMQIVNEYHQIIINELSSGGDVEFVGFGKYTTVDRQERTGRNPQTGAAILIPASRLPKFKPGKKFKDAVKR